MESSYNPLTFEGKLYEKWEASGAFAPESNSSKKPFLITMPPPNVTGALHMGHALFISIQDTYARWKRMRGYNTLWLPGIDHAGIATQVMVERQVEAEGTSRVKMGRDAFLKRVWEWKEEYGGTIMKQFRALGSSCDWSRELFTMDPKSSRAVRESFTRLYHEGLIYRGERIVNWSSGLQTAISDLEVEPKTVQGAFYYLKYMLADESGDFITVATTRPETVFADVAVAVHPDDERMKRFHGKEVVIPLADRKIPIILDPYVDKDFGAGALKITPGHDVNDWQIGQRHKLKTLSVINKDGKLNELAGKFCGMIAAHSRKKVAEELTLRGLLLKEEKHVHDLGHCQRTGVVVEPLISMQWFIKMQPLADKALRAAQGENPAIRFYPEFWRKTFFEWLTNIQDWCISRQLWWGHQIPAWHCKDCQKITVPQSSLEPDPQNCAHCNSLNIEQDPDVLDTWYSSGLWPISTLGWPEKTQDLNMFYPKQKFQDPRRSEEAMALMETGSDILFFWVARMVMMCTHFMDGRVPFEDVYLHSMVRDEKGQKMSKTKGNVIDPLDITKKHGADAVRVTLLALSGQGSSVNLDLKRLEGYAAFLNKIWNASRFALIQLEGKDLSPVSKDLFFGDAWILARLSKVTDEVNRCLEEYRTDAAFHAIYQFTWYEFCDWYVELYKLNRGSSPHTLKTVLEAILKLLHPFAPFMTEQIYLNLPWEKEHTLLSAHYPAGRNYPLSETEHPLSKMAALQEAVSGVRTFRTENQISPKENIRVFFEARNLALWEELSPFIKSLAKIDAAEPLIEKNAGRSGNVYTQAFSFVIPLDGLVDGGAEKQRLMGELKKAQEDLSFVEKRLSNKAFVEKAKTELIEKERARARDFKDKVAALEAAINKLR